MRSMWFSPAVLALASLSCAAHPEPGPSAPVVRWLKPSETASQGRAPGAKVRLLATQSDGTKTYVLVLYKGDQVQAAITAFAASLPLSSVEAAKIQRTTTPEYMCQGCD